MPERADDELKLLAQAFDRAWNRYYRPSRIGAIPKARLVRIFGKELRKLKYNGWRAL
jgi:hypothetical protein